LAEVEPVGYVACSSRIEPDGIEHATPLDKTQLAAYKRKLERLGASADNAAIARLTEDIEQLR
jgi:hypothetical protein